MSFFHRMVSRFSIRTKLVVSFLVVATIALVVGGVGTLAVHHLDEQTSNIHKTIVQPLQKLAVVAADFQKIRVNVRQYIDVTDPDEAESYEERIQELFELNSSLAEDYGKTIRDAQEKKIYQEFMGTFSAYRADVAKVFEWRATGQQAEAKEYILEGDGYRAARDSQRHVDALIALKGKQGEEAAANASRDADRTGYFLLGFAGVGFVVALFIGYLTSVGVGRPLRSLSEKAEAIANGDLTVEVVAETKDELGALCVSFAHMKDSLKTTVEQVTGVARDVATSSGELANNAQSLAGGTQELSAQATTVATASEEMAATSSSIAESCHMAADEAVRAGEAAQAGVNIAMRSASNIKGQIEQTRDNAGKVTSLGERSNQIGAIVATIEDIADQTNLLALNAAIEAARAGEQGRGFAVVADEVRALAERTAKATREIGGMIKTIQTETQVAVESMQQQVEVSQAVINDSDELGASLEAIMQRINEVTMQVNQIATAAEEQTATTGEIANNIIQMSQVVEQSSHGAHNVSGASAQLSDLARDMQALVARF